MERISDITRKIGRGIARTLYQSNNSNSSSVKGKISFDSSDTSLPISGDLEQTISSVEALINEASGLKIRRIERSGVPFVVFYVDDLVDVTRLETSILLPLQERDTGNQPDSIVTETIHSAKETHIYSVQDIVWAILDGKCVVLSKGWKEAIGFDVRKSKTRQVTEPHSERTLGGPHHGFVEDLPTNINLLRRSIKHPRLRLISLTVGRISRTQVVVLYIEGITRVDLVTEVLSRLKRIDVDIAEDANHLAEFMEDCPFSPFPQIGTTERPDRVVSALVQGRVAIMTDGSPSTMMVPFPAISFLQSPDDYYERWPLSMITRIVRLISAIVALFFPSAFLAVITFHQEIIPRNLALAIAIQRERVPYPAIVELLLLTVVFEIVTEAAIRLPQALGQTIGIVGTLVIGESAARANLVSNVSLIVVAATAIAQYTVTPTLTTAIRFLRVPLLLLSAFLGIFGAFSGVIIILLHLCSLRSFGFPYLSPYTPLSITDMSDSTIRLPRWMQTRRPEIIGDKNPVRIRPGQEPTPPKEASERLELETIPKKVLISTEVPKASSTDSRKTSVKYPNQRTLSERVITGKTIGKALKRIFGRSH